VFPPPGITRARALEVLEREGRAWRTACTSGSLSGLVAAARAGLGVMAHTRGLVPPGLARVPGLPDLGPVEFALLRGPRVSAAAEALAAAVLSGADRLTRTG
jgi:DNA-binding transcriptional LysR family regulator